MSTDEIERLTKDVEQYHMAANELRGQVERLTKENEELKNSNLRPVAWTENIFYEDGTPNPCCQLAWAGDNGPDDFPIGTKFYTTPPQAEAIDTAMRGEGE